MSPLFALLLLSSPTTPLRASGKYWSAKADVPVLPGSSALVRFANRDLRESMTKEFRTFSRDFTQQIKDLGKPVANLFYEATPKFSTTSPTLISGHVLRFWFSGGAHPNTQIRTFNYAMVNGKPKSLTLADVLRPGVTPDSFVERHLLAAAMVTNIDRNYWNSFVIEEKGMTWLFEPYAIGPYSEGTRTAFLPWKDLAGDVRRLR